MHINMCDRRKFQHHLIDRGCINQECFAPLLACHAGVVGIRNHGDPTRSALDFLNGSLGSCGCGTYVDLRLPALEIWSPSEFGNRPRSVIFIFLSSGNFASVFLNHSALRLQAFGSVFRAFCLASSFVRISATQIDFTHVSQICVTLIFPGCSACFVRSRN